MMRRLTIFAGVLALTACGVQPEAASEPEETVTDFTLANGAPPGMYEMTGGDGSSSIITIAADGTFSQMTPEGTHGATGTLEVVNGQTCFRLRERGAEPLCYTEGELADDGSFTTTPDGGEAIEVRPYSPDGIAEGMPGNITEGGSAPSE